MAVWSRILLLVFIVGIGLYALAQYPDYAQWVNDYKDEISSVSALVTIAVPLIVLARWIFVGKAEKRKGDKNFTFNASRDIIGGDKSETYNYHSKENKQAEKQGKE